MLSNGMDPVHLLLVVGSLDEVMSVCLRDDFKQVSLNVAFHTCGTAGRVLPLAQTLAAVSPFLLQV